MPVYVDTEGNRYWFDGEPDPDLTRPDLVIAPLDLQDGPEAAAQIMEYMHMTLETDA